MGMALSGSSQDLRFACIPALGGGDRRVGSSRLKRWEGGKDRRKQGRKEATKSLIYALE
jgi:hypothetical protein